MTETYKRIQLETEVSGPKFVSDPLVGEEKELLEKYQAGLALAIEQGLLWQVN